MDVRPARALSGERELVSVRSKSAGNVRLRAVSTLECLTVSAPRAVASFLGERELVSVRFLCSVKESRS